MHTIYAQTLSNKSHAMKYYKRIWTIVKCTRIYFSNACLSPPSQTRPSTVPTHMRLATERDFHTPFNSYLAYNLTVNKPSKDTFSANDRNISKTWVRCGAFPWLLSASPWGSQLSSLSLSLSFCYLVHEMHNCIWKIFPQRYFSHQTNCQPVSLSLTGKLAEKLHYRFYVIRALKIDLTPCVSWPGTSPLQNENESELSGDALVWV